MSYAHKVKIFEDVRNLIADEKHWTQKVNARNNMGTSVAPTDPDACQWCLYGAMFHGFQTHESYYHLRETARLIDDVENILGHSITGFNDSHTHQEVLLKVDEILVAFRHAAINHLDTSSP